jgi:aldose sugar dehydrogenase
MTKRFSLFICLLVSACAKCAANAPGTNTDPSEPRIVREQIYSASGSVIWDMAFLPDDSLLFTVRSGRVRRLVPGESSATLVADKDDPALAGVFSEGQSGLMGIAVDPAFAQNRRVYLYFSHERDGIKDNRVARYTLSEQWKLVDRTDIVTGISYKTAATAQGSAGSHSGGRLRFGPDGQLYLTTGDNHNATVPQDPEALGGKILRFTVDGEAAPNNPGIGSRGLVWALGFRNPQGIDFHPVSGDVFISEHGPNQDDEVTKLSAGGNGGWIPVGPNGAYNGYTGALMTDTSKVPGAVPPVWVVEDSDGMSACVFLRGASWKAWRNRLAVGFLAGRRINVIALNDGLTAVTEQDTMPDVSDRVRGLTMGPDDKLYVSTDAGVIYRYTAQ